MNELIVIFLLVHLGGVIYYCYMSFHKPYDLVDYRKNFIEKYGYLPTRTYMPLIIPDKFEVFLHKITSILFIIVDAAILVMFSLGMFS